ncbi:hypothetical protein [Candidatus Hodgkinia cicadicola]|uniref:hypothetical protein n=1 Tax=Candidatus Hodgkinia cicadicola TaxID=573658 RepID=UPI001788D8D6
MLRRQHNEKYCLSLSNFIDGNNDNISTCCCFLGIEFTLMYRYFNDKKTITICFMF